MFCTTCPTSSNGRWLRRALWLSSLLLFTACQWPSASQPVLPAIPQLKRILAWSFQQPTWQPIQPGVEWQIRNVNQGTMYLVRIKPDQVRIRVAYDPQTPKNLRDWVSTLQPVVAINGGYFDPAYQATALTIADGIASGQSYDGFGGMLAVDGQGQVELRSLENASAAVSDDLQQAVQSFPRLVWDGQPLPFEDDGQTARRTVVATDDAGRLLLIVTDQPVWTLTDLGQWLAQSDLGIVRALNLDGGPSTGLAINTTPTPLLLDSFTVLPQIILIEAR